MRTARGRFSKSGRAPGRSPAGSSTGWAAPTPSIWWNSTTRSSRNWSPLSGRAGVSGRRPAGPRPALPHRGPARPGKYDVIVSGLPLNNFSPADVERILAVLCGRLAPRGTLSFFEYIAMRPARALVSGRSGGRGCGGSAGRCGPCSIGTRSAATPSGSTSRPPGSITCGRKSPCRSLGGLGCRSGIWPLPVPLSSGGLRASQPVPSYAECGTRRLKPLEARASLSSLIPHPLSLIPLPFPSWPKGRNLLQVPP